MASYPLKSFFTLLALNVGLFVFAVSVAHSEHKDTFAKNSESAQIAATLASVAENSNRTIASSPKVLSVKVSATTTKTVATSTKKTTPVKPLTEKVVEKKPVKKVEKKVEKKAVTAAPKVEVKTASVEVKTTQIAAPSNFASRFEQLVIDYMNKERKKEGLGLLSPDAKLATIARAHSADMLDKNFFDHTNQNGCDAECRIDNAHYSWWSYGENIHWMSGYDFSIEEAAEKVVEDWMNSPGHRKNILGKDFTNVGVGVVMEEDTFYTTADYSEPQ